MKKILKYSVLCAMAGAISLATSCADFLDTKPTGQLTEEEVYAQLETSAMAVAGLYDRNIQAMQGDNFTRQLVGTDEAMVVYARLLAQDGEGSFDTYSDRLNGNSAYLLKPWEAFWRIIAEANKVVDALNSNESDEAKQLVAEARFMRALAMFRVSVLWGEIPITDKAHVTEFGYKRQPLNVVWEFIINDFKLASDVLPLDQSDEQRPTRYAALAMLGKSLMYVPESTGLRDFAEADLCFLEIIGSGKFDLVPNYKDLWNNQAFEYPDIPASGTFPDRPDLIKTPDFKVNGKSESVFTIQFRRPPGNDSYINVWQWCAGTWESTEWFDGEAAWIAGYNFIRPTMFAYEDKNDVAGNHDYEFPDPVEGPQLKDKGEGVWEDGDLRKDASIRYEWYYYTNQYTDQPPLSFGVNNIADYRKGTNPFRWIHINERKSQLSGNMRDALNPAVKKWEDFRCDRFTNPDISMFRTHKPFAMIRYADILLLHAECLSETGQLGEAINIVQNQIRKRAWGDATPPVWNPGSPDEFRRMVMDERMRELAFEGWRRCDLIRTGLFVDLVKTRNDWTKAEPGHIDENNAHWPLPISEIVELGWTQNPGYTE